MANKRKISTEKLQDIIKDYIDNNKYISKLKYTELVKHSEKMGYDNLNPQDFIRNTEIKNLIDEFNKTNKMSQFLKNNKDLAQPRYLKLDVESIIENTKDTVTQKALLNIFKDNYNSAFDELQRLDNENRELKNIISKLTKELKEVKEKNREYKMELLSKKEEVKLQEKIDKEQRCLEGINFLINRSLVSKLNKEDVNEIMKRLFKQDYNDIIEIENININDGDKEVGDEDDFKSNVVEFKLPNLF